MTTLIITFTAKPAMLAAFRGVLSEVRRSLPQVEGCRSVQIFNKADDPCTFTLVESWISRDAHQRHLKTVIASGAWNHIVSHLASDPASGWFDPF